LLRTTFGLPVVLKSPRKPTSADECSHTQMPCAPFCSIVLSTTLTKLLSLAMTPWVTALRIELVSMKALPLLCTCTP
jgi:hypothetical protein